MFNDDLERFGFGKTRTTNHIISHLILILNVPTRMETKAYRRRLSFSTRPRKTHRRNSKIASSSGTINDWHLFRHYKIQTLMMKFYFILFEAVRARAHTHTGE
jgi:hypothetical protein